MQIADYLIGKLSQAGVRHVFGVPGDYVLGFFSRLNEGPLQIVGTCDEQGAGFAADAYARAAGLGAVCVTYGVGGLKLVNTTAQAFAERSPVVVISGAPGLRETGGDPLLHHKVRGFDTQWRVFQEITAAAVVLDDPTTAAREIDRAVETALRTKCPVYIELPRDMVAAQCQPGPAWSPPVPASDPDALREAVAEAVVMLRRARRPVILAGVELHRFGLAGLFARFVDRTGIAFATTLLGKSVIAENHPLFAGVYEGGMCRDEIRTFVEEADCLLLLGAVLTDVDTGIFTHRLDPGRTIAATSQGLQIRSARYDVRLEDFMVALAAVDVSYAAPRPLPKWTAPAPFVPRPGHPVRMERLFQCLNAFLDDDTAVVADTGDALFAAAELVVHGATKFLANAYYASLGFAVPGSIGVQLATGCRPLALVGDGAFQMTGLEVSTAARYGLTPIVVVLDNGGYGTERPMLDGPFNDVRPWDHTALPALIGAGSAVRVETEDQLQAALAAARADTGRLAILQVKLDPHDISPALRRLTDRLKRQV
ncbi:MAG: thiamine pyrophosphate-binding protein [Magnetospirillum sp.]|nr:thiamine pyrophosphate-binding protein [Magnetospirillum sp.]